MQMMLRGVEKRGRMKLEFNDFFEVKLASFDFLS